MSYVGVCMEVQVPLEAWGLRCPGARVVSLPAWGLGLNLGHLQKQYVLLTTEPSLQYHG